MRDKTGAVIDRLVIVPFTATFSKDDPDFDPYIKYKLRTPEAMSYLINLGLDGLNRVLQNRCFTLPRSAEQEIEEYEVIANPVLSFFDMLERDTIIGQSTDTIYQHYCEWAIKAGVSPMGSIQLTRQINKEFFVTTRQTRVNGEKIRIYCGKE